MLIRRSFRNVTPVKTFPEIACILMYVIISALMNTDFFAYFVPIPT